MIRFIRAMFERWGFTQRRAEPSEADDALKRARDAAERARRLDKESTEDLEKKRRFRP